MNIQAIARIAAPTACLALAMAASNLHAAPCRILCVGDSITQGGKTDREEWTYRLPLQRLLHEAGISYDFVGSKAFGFGTAP